MPGYFVTVALPLAVLVAPGSPVSAEPTAASAARTADAVSAFTQETTPAPQPSPPPGPPPPPVDCMSGPFIIFFSWNRATLTHAARDILDNSVVPGSPCAAGSLGSAILVTGFTDRSGRPRHNLALARRRADAVKAYYLAHGIASKQIMVRAFGERPDQLRLATPDGTRKAQNRRVEITLGPPTESQARFKP